MPVLPTLIDEFEAVAVGVEHVGGVVAGVVVQARPRCAVVGGSGGDGGGVGGIDLGGAVGDEADVRGAAFDGPAAQPEDHSAVSAEALEIGMVWRA